MLDINVGPDDEITEHVDISVVFDGWARCSCGESFDSAAAWAAHVNGDEITGEPDPDSWGDARLEDYLTYDLSETE